MYQSHDSSKKVGYFYNTQIGKFKYCKSHPMKPKRVSMTHSLIKSYEQKIIYFLKFLYSLYKELDVYMSREATKQELEKYHHPEYVKYLSQFISEKSFDILSKVQLPQWSKLLRELDINTIQSHLLFDNCIDWQSVGVGDFDSYYNKILQQENPFFDHTKLDQPMFKGVYTFSQLSAGASIDCAHLIMRGDADIAINWAGGLHHAKKQAASGFCYINDIVLCILELLTQYPRVLYLDIDAHHGDGVEEAFQQTNRVMTVSLHQYGENFFPETGSIDQIGVGEGRGYAVNVPLKKGMDDDTYRGIFRFVISEVMKVFQPNVIVMQCGADSLAYDELGQFNMTIRGHGDCIEFIKSQGLPLILLGGGGYTVKNVARCWAYETGICVNKIINSPIPKEDQYFERYKPDCQLHFPVETKHSQQNTKDEIERMRVIIGQNLKDIQPVPGIPFHNIPQKQYDPIIIDSDDDNNQQQIIQKFKQKNKWTLN